MMFPSFDITKAYTGGYGDFSGASSKAKSGGGGVDPFSIALAGIGGVGSALGGFFGSQGASQAALQNAISAGAALQYRQAEALGGLAQARWGALANQTFEDIGKKRQEDAERFKRAWLRPSDLAYATEVAERGRAFAGDPRTREQSARDRKNELEMAYLKSSFQDPSSRRFGRTGPEMALAGKYGLFA